MKRVLRVLWCLCIINNMLSSQSHIFFFLGKSRYLILIDDQIPCPQIANKTGYRCLKQKDVGPDSLLK